MARGNGERPIVESAEVHGKQLEPFLDFYPVQVEALKALWAAVHEATGIPYEAPLNEDGETSTTYEQKCCVRKLYWLYQPLPCK